MLNEYRTGWKKEVDTILEKYMECRDESIVKQKEQGLLEVRTNQKLRCINPQSHIHDLKPAISDPRSLTSVLKPKVLNPRSQTYDLKPTLLYPRS